MKQSKKIILALIIVLLICLIKTTSFATLGDDIENGKTVSVDLNVLHHDNRIFCIERDKPLNWGNYRKDTSIKPNPVVYDKTNQPARAWILSAIKDMPKNPNAEESGDVQKAYWTLLGEYNYSDLSDRGQKLYNKALAYVEYVKSIEAFKAKYNQTEYAPVFVKKDTNIKEVSGNIVKVGPFNIEYARAWYNHQPFGTLTLKLVDSNGKQLTDGAWFVGENSSGAVELKQTVVDTNLILANKDFYLKIDISKVSDISLQVTCDEEEAVAKVYYLITDNKYSISGPYWCNDCRNKYSSKWEYLKGQNLATNSVVYVDGNTNKCYIYKNGDKDLKEITYANNNFNKYYYKYVNKLTGGNIGTQYELSKTTTNKWNLYCNRCGRIGTNITSSEFANYKTTHDNMHRGLGYGAATYTTEQVTSWLSAYQYKVYPAGCGRNGCGTYKSESLAQQKLLLLDSYKRTSNVRTPGNISLSLNPRITLSKTDAKTGAKLANTRFKGTITNVKGLTVFDTTTDSKGNISYNLAMQDRTKPVVITITEISAPSGNGYYYRKLDGTITITLKYNSAGKLDVTSNYTGSRKDEVTITSDGLNVSIAIKNTKILNPYITLSKTETQAGTKLANVRFTGSCENIKDLKNFDLVTNSAGNILKYVVLEDPTKPAKIIIKEISVPSGNGYYYRKLDGTITITIRYNSSFDGVTVTSEYTGSRKDEVNVTSNGINVLIAIKNTKVVDVSGKVWLDGNTGIKPVVGPNGKYDSRETLLENIYVELLDESGNVVNSTYTNKNGAYKFTNVVYGNKYKVRFTYDGVNYEDTIYGQDSKARETDADRNNFNAKFKTIEYNKSNGVNKLEYSYANGKSTLITTNNDEHSTVKNEFRITSNTEVFTANSGITGLNLGLVKRGVDLALSTDVSSAQVKINGQKTNYTYNNTSKTIEIGSKPTSEQVSYNLNLYTSDYNYRVRDYVNKDEFAESNFDEKANGLRTGDKLEVYVTYQLIVANQSTKNATVNKVKYRYDSKYEYVGADGANGLNIKNNSNSKYLDITGITLGDGASRTISLTFKVTETVDQRVNLGTFSNTAEIMSYSTTEGLIDIDSQPGNLEKNNQQEDDSDKAGGITITVPEKGKARILNGNVFDKDTNTTVNDVIVQLIELKEYKGKTYEYIWEETRTGSGEGKKLSNDGQGIEKYSYDKQNGKYEFQGFIPGDYIVRFIYGDGSTYDLTNNTIKYNGQDYKSTSDKNYQAEWYNPANYGANASVARDNEARRLETMAYSVLVDKEKGIDLKLLDKNLQNIGQDLDRLKGVLSNTWMCAETSKIKVQVDTENTQNTSSTNTVNGVKSYSRVINGINLGLEERPETKIKLEKHITGLKLTANNGQTLVNTHVDISKYLEKGININSVLEGVRDGLSVVEGVAWKYEVSPTEINTVVDGSKLEFVYSYVIRNNSESDYLSETLYKDYNNTTIEQYANNLKAYSKAIKKDMRKVPYTSVAGSYLGTTYYTGVATGRKVETEITKIRDYLDNNLEYVNGTNVVKDDEASGTVCYVLGDDYSLREAKINTILKLTETTGKMTNDTKPVTKYSVTLGKNPISSTGTLVFENYIAEVMEYTNAAGRRAKDSSPANAEIIDKELREGRAHEPDEALAERIQIGAATGEDEKTKTVWIAVITGGIAVIAAGAFVTKKYIIK